MVRIGGVIARHALLQLIEHGVDHVTGKHIRHQFEPRGNICRLQKRLNQGSQVRHVTVVQQHFELRTAVPILTDFEFMTLQFTERVVEHQFCVYF